MLETKEEESLRVVGSNECVGEEMSGDIIRSVDMGDKVLTIVQWTLVKD